MKDTKRIIFEMGRVNFSIKMEAITMGNGETTKCTVGESSSMKEENWLMKGTGQKKIGIRTVGKD